MPRWLACTVVALLVGAGSPASARDELLSPSYADLNREGRDSLERLLGTLINGDPTLRNAAVHRLDAVGRAAIPPLRGAAMESSDPRRVSLACLALGAIGEPSCFAILSETLLSPDSKEDELRGALLGLALDSDYPSPDVAERVRELAVGREGDQVARLAVLVAAARRLGGITELIAPRVASERNPLVRAAHVLALGEAGDAAAAPVLVRELRGNKNELVRKAALLAASRLGTEILLEPILALQPRNTEVVEYCVALGAFADSRAAGRLIQMLTRYRDAALAAVFALAQSGSTEAAEGLERALTGEFGDPVQRAACLAAATGKDPSRFLPMLRELGSASERELRRTALLAAAYLEDRELAMAVAERLPREPQDVLDMALLLCASLPETDVCVRIPDSNRTGSVDALCRTVQEIRDGRRDPRVLAEDVRLLLERARAHWSLQRQDARQRLLVRILQLDRIDFDVTGESEGGFTSFGTLLQQRQSSQDSGSADGGSGDAGGTGDSGSGGGGDTGGSDGSDPGSGGSDSGGSADPGGDSSGSTGNATPGAPPNVPAPSSPSLGLRARSRKTELFEFEQDMIRWVRDFPMFAEQPAFLR